MVHFTQVKIRLRALHRRARAPHLPNNRRICTAAAASVDKLSPLPRAKGKRRLNPKFSISALRTTVSMATLARVVTFTRLYKRFQKVQKKGGQKLVPAPSSACSAFFAGAGQQLVEKGSCGGCSCAASSCGTMLTTTIHFCV